MDRFAEQLARLLVGSVDELFERSFVEPLLVGPDGRESAAFAFLEAHRRVALVAPGGSGKTALLSTFALRSARAFLEGAPSGRAPIFVRARDCLENFSIGAVLRVLVPDLLTWDIGTLLDSGKVCLIVDGLDEMVDPRQGAYHIATLLRRHPTLDMIVASRAGAIGAELSALTSCSLAPFTPDQVTVLLGRLGLGDEHSARRFVAFLQAHDLSSIAQSPALVRILFEISDGGTAPFVSPADFYADMLDEGVRRAALITEPPLDPDLLLHIMGELAVQLFVQNRLSIPVAEAALQWFNANASINSDHIPAQLAASHLLTLDGGHLAFVHSSIQDFLVASHLRDKPAQLLEVLEIDAYLNETILPFAAGLADEVAPLVEACLGRRRLLEAITCLRFAKVDNQALSSLLAVELGGRIGEGFIERLMQQIPPDLDHPSSPELSVLHDRLLGLLDDACDAQRSNHERGRRFEEFCEAFLSGPFETVSCNYRTDHGELDLVMEIRSEGRFWREWGADISVECKNLAGRVEAHQVHAFGSKVETARIKLGFLVSVNGFTRDALLAAQDFARMQSRPLIVPLAGDDIRKLLQRRGPIEDFFKERARDILYERRARGDGGRS